MMWKIVLTFKRRQGCEKQDFCVVVYYFTFLYFFLFHGISSMVLEIALPWAIGYLYPVWMGEFLFVLFLLDRTETLKVKMRERY